MQTIIIRNQRELTTGGVKLLKVDCCDCSLRLRGAQFDLWMLDPQIGQYRLIRQCLTTDQNGMLQAEGLVPGQYRFVEVRPPHGYEIAGMGYVDFYIGPGSMSDAPVIVVGNHRACPPRRCCICCN